ncbi:MAG: DNA-binding protein [Saprospiraceae bacterium]|nr:DNA-binding protein [Saprospiraceae bacterium]
MKNIFESLGNREILTLYKVGFLCSRKITSAAVLKCYDWAIEQRQKGRCVMTGFHSPLEREVCEILLKGDQPVIIALARGIRQRMDPLLKKSIEEGRLLIISEFQNNVIRTTKESAFKRNEFLIQLADEIVIGHVSSGRSLQKLLLGNGNNKRVIYL